MVFAGFALNRNFLKGKGVVKFRATEYGIYSPLGLVKYRNADETASKT